jgi:hypothetical protein
MLQKTASLVLIFYCAIAFSFWGSGSKKNEDILERAQQSESSTQQDGESLTPGATAEWKFAKKDYSRKIAKSQPTVVDSVLRGKEAQMPNINPELRNSAGEFDHLKQESTESANSIWVLQFESVPDFDAAQKRRGQLSYRTGMGVYLVFDAPFTNCEQGAIPAKPWQKRR